MTMARERVERGREAPPPRPALTVGELHQLISLMNSTDLEEIVIEQQESGLRVVLRKAPAPAALAAPSVEPARLARSLRPARPVEPVEAINEVEAIEPDEAEVAERMIEVRAPLVGVFRSSLKPSENGAASPSVLPGQDVKEGQIVGAIESLNVLNEIEAPAKGLVKDVLVSDGQAVEYGQLLVVIAADES